MDVQQNLQQRFSKIITPYITQGKIPGYCCLVSKGEKEIGFVCEGLMDVERNRPMKRDTIFRIYSMTKPITSIAFMQLYEQGLVRLDDPVDRYIPQWKNLQVFKSGDADNYDTCAPSRPMQILDLLNHTSGLTYFFQTGHPVDELYRRHGIDGQAETGTLEEKVDRLKNIPLQFSPGTKWNYSVATDAIGYIIQVIANQPLDDYINHNICNPLGMNHTGFYVSSGQQNRFSSCYEHVESDSSFRLQSDPLTSNFLAPPHFLSGGGGMVSTIDDYQIFVSMLLNHGVVNNKRIIKQSTLQLMTQNQLPGNQDLAAMGISTFSEMPYKGIGFGLGFSVVIDPAKTDIPASLGEYAWGGAASTYFWVDPVEQLTAVFMTQLFPSHAYPLRCDLRYAVYGEEAKPI